MLGHRFADRVRLTDRWIETAADSGMGIDEAATMMDQRIRQIAEEEGCDLGEAHVRALARLIAEHGR